MTTRLLPSAPESWQRLWAPLANITNLHALPAHIHIILGFAAFYQVIFYASSIISHRTTHYYRRLPKRSRINWDIHVVSQVQSILICSLAWYVYGDPVLANDRVHGYSARSADVFAMACGYFLWDTYVSIRYIDDFGFGFAMHGLASLIVFSFAFRPFLMYYGPAVLFYELSTPFVNVHWFLDKVDMTGSTLQLVNGIILTTTFFLSRIVWGSYIAYVFIGDLWTAYNAKPSALPLWLPCVYVIANMSLNALNWYWFSKMIDSLRRRAQVGEHKQDDSRKKI